jgi:hypothetical protein
LQGFSKSVEALNWTTSKILASASVASSLGVSAETSCNKQKDEPGSATDAGKRRFAEELAEVIGKVE